MRTTSRWLLTLMLGWSMFASAAGPVAGRDYTDIEPAQPTTDPTKIVVTEFFSYQCPHCAAFAPTLSAWIKTLPADVKFERVPVSLGRPTWQPAARAYIALASMNALAKVDDAIFSAIHRQGVRMDTEEQVASWLGTQGVDAKAFTSMYRSFGVDMQYKSAEARARAHRIPSIPAIVVDGRYLVAIEDAGPGREAHFKTQLGSVNELIAKARAQRPKPGAAPAAAKKP